MRKKWGYTDSNCEPSSYEPPALTIELYPRYPRIKATCESCPSKGPATYAVSDILKRKSSGEGSVAFNSPKEEDFIDWEKAKRGLLEQVSRPPRS